jgi:hypothetical protein
LTVPKFDEIVDGGELPPPPGKACVHKVAKLTKSGLGGGLAAKQMSWRYCRNCASTVAATACNGISPSTNNKTENLPTNAQRPTLDLIAPEFISPPGQIAYEQNDISKTPWFVVTLN